MSYGLSERDISTIQRIFSKFAEVHSVYIFGSRALGTFQSGSDIDLAILDESVSTETIRRIVAEFEDSSLPYHVDLLHYPSLQNKELREHIMRVGKMLFAQDRMD
jgi:predicted nucleotidyltransferase